MQVWTVQPREVMDEARKCRQLDGPYLPMQLSRYSPGSALAVAWMAYQLYQRRATECIGGMFWFYVSTREEVIHSELARRTHVHEGPQRRPTLAEMYAMEDRPMCVARLNIPDDRLLVTAINLWENAMVGVPLACSLEEDEGFVAQDRVDFAVVSKTWERMFDRSFTANGYYGDPAKFIWQATSGMIRREWIIDVEELERPMNP